MSILIKDMDMPKNCAECGFSINCDYCEGYECFCAVLGKNIGYFSEVPKDFRLGDCPLVEVPPHGRLIDADALEGVLIFTLESLKENPKMNKEEMHLIAAFHTLGVMIDDAPTIIEAEVDE